MSLSRLVSAGEGSGTCGLRTCYHPRTSDRSCFFDQLPGLSELRNACVVFGALVGDSLLQISLGLPCGLCHLFLHQFNLSVSFALHLIDSLDQQFSSLFIPLPVSTDFDLKLSLGFPNGLFIFAIEPLDFTPLKKRLENAVEDVVREAERMAKHGRHAVEDVRDDTTYWIKKNPWQSVQYAAGAAFGVGLCIGWFTSRLSAHCYD